MSPSSTSIGTGAKKMMFGRENQRAAIAGWASGVQRLTIAITASKHERDRPARVPSSAAAVRLRSS